MISSLIRSDQQLEKGKPEAFLQEQVISKFGKKLPRLLVIDDEKEICDFVTFVAEGAGYDVVSTTDPEQFGLFYSNELDVIVLDLSMPGLDGIELIRFLGENRSQAAIVLMSGFDRGILQSAEHIARSQGLQVLNAIEKPVKFEVLEKTLLNVPSSAIARPQKSPDDQLTPEELQKAITENELTVFYQPRIEMKTHRLAGVEALARWRHPEKGMISPAHFIPLAEESGLINELTVLVMNEALGQCGRWKTSGTEIQVSINFSTRTLTDLEFPDNLQSLSRSYGLDPSQVVIEVTESSVMGELARSLDILTRLRMKGFHLSIDDFGTGYSSMQQLQKVAFNELKVDQSFITRLDNDDEARTIVEATIELGHKLGMTVVGEGIETEAVWDILAELGCDQAQGFLMGKPMAVEDFDAWLENGWISQGK